MNGISVCTFTNPRCAFSSAGAGGCPGKACAVSDRKITQANFILVIELSLVYKTSRTGGKSETDFDLFVRLCLEQRAAEATSMPIQAVAFGRSSKQKLLRQCGKRGNGHAGDPAVTSRQDVSDGGFGYAAFVAGDFVANVKQGREGQRDRHQADGNAGVACGGTLPTCSGPRAGWHTRAPRLRRFPTSLRPGRATRS